eukprot:m.23941 g.23941  ORF g.23941 m.23941 type:complete len:380 (+) comp5598_c1_seq1:7-1146(+)
MWMCESYLDSSLLFLLLLYLIDVLLLYNAGNMSFAPFGQDTQPQFVHKLVGGKLMYVPISQAYKEASTSATVLKPLSKFQQQEIKQDVFFGKSKLQEDIDKNADASIKKLLSLLQNAERDVSGHVLHEHVIDCFKRAQVVVNLTSLRSWLCELDTRKNGTACLLKIKEGIETSSGFYSTTSTVPSNSVVTSTPTFPDTTWKHSTFNSYPPPLPPIQSSSYGSSQALHKRSSIDLVLQMTQQPHQARTSLPPEEMVQQQRQQHGINIRDPDMCHSHVNIDKQTANNDDGEPLLDSWTEGFTALTRALLTLEEHDGYLASVEVARTVSKFNVIYDLKLPMRIIADLIESGETDDGCVLVTSFCQDLLATMRIVRRDTGVNA